MARTAPKKEISQIRQFTSREDPNNIKNWLPSVVSPPAGDDFSKEYLETFTIPGTNVIPQTDKVIAGKKDDIKDTSTGEINQITIFGNGTDKAGIQYTNSGVLEPFNLNRFYLILYCLRNSPYLFEESNQIRIQEDTDVLMPRSFSKFLEVQQTSAPGSIKPYSNGFAADSVRTYRSTEAKKVGSKVSDDKDIATILKYARTDVNYLNYVAGSLGKVAYDSIVKTTLYSILQKEGIISQRIRKGEAWDEEAAKLPYDTFGYWIDPTGGTYTRGFPVISVFTNSNTQQTEDSLIQKANDYLSSQFFRKVGGPDGKGKNELVIPITVNKKPVGGEKYFIELPNRTNSGYTYCFIYDFAKVITLKPNIENDYTLDLLKIGLSFLSRQFPKQVFKNKEEFTLYYQGIKQFLRASYGDSLEKQDFSVLLKIKHAEECSYSLNKGKENFEAKLQNSFKAELENLLNSLELSYSKIIEIFDQQTKAGDARNFQFNNYPVNSDYPIILYYDNFYNLLAVASRNNSSQENKKEYDQNSPFKVEDYVVNFEYGNLVKDFFDLEKNKDKVLPTIPANVQNPTYFFTPAIGLNDDIVLITDVFLKQLYDILEENKNGFIYENEENKQKDGVLKADSIKLLEEIKNRTGKELKKEDYFILSNNKIYLKKDVVRKLSLDELTFSFESVKEQKIKFQTISRLLFLNLDELKKKSLTPDDFKNTIYYPILALIQPPPPPPPPPGVKSPEKKSPNRDFLINNIISSELACYEDIANSFDKALNAEKIEDQVYYVFQSLVNIGLPILLAMAAQEIANKIKQLKKPGEELNESLLECVSSEQDNLRKNVIGFLDLILNIDDLDKLAGFLTQGAFEVPKLPNIPYFLTFDAEKELKRRVIEFLIKSGIEYLSSVLKKSLQPLIDMCNADSYITAFLTNAFPNDQTSGKKQGIASPSGYPVNSSNIYIPALIADINILIDQTGAETRTNVYKYFREKYGLKDYYSPDEEISRFFTYLSNTVDAAELASLLKGAGSIQTRNVIVGAVKNFDFVNNVLADSIDDIYAVADLFAFLAQYIDYSLCYGIISSALNNFSADVCNNVDSLFDENALSFGEIAVDDKIIELTKNLNEICELKTPPSVDLLAGGPSLLTNTLKKSLQTAVNSNIDTLSQFYSSLLANTSKPEDKATTDLVGSISNIPEPAIKQENFVYQPLPDFGEGPGAVFAETAYMLVYAAKQNQYIYEDKFEEIYKIISKYIVSEGNIDKSKISNKDKFVYYMNKIANDYLANFRQITSANIELGQRIENLKNIFALEKDVNKNALKNNFLNKLNNSGNIGLKTELAVFDGYIRKLDQLKKDKVSIVQNLPPPQK